jgi:hypothetical protein
MENRLSPSGLGVAGFRARERDKDERVKSHLWGYLRGPGRGTGSCDVAASRTSPWPPFGGSDGSPTVLASPPSPPLSVTLDASRP